MNTDINEQQNGFNGWHLASDVARVAYVDFTTGHEKCQTLTQRGSASDRQG